MTLTHLHIFFLHWRIQSEIPDINKNKHTQNNEVYLLILRLLCPHLPYQGLGNINVHIILNNYCTPYINLYN